VPGFTLLLTFALYRHPRHHFMALKPQFTVISWRYLKGTEGLWWTKGTDLKTPGRRRITWSTMQAWDGGAPFRKDRRN
jgi:hypothetical protein